jgi:hypothetical protein
MIDDNMFKGVLPPYQITGQLRILRQTLIIIFGEENI